MSSGPGSSGKPWPKLMALLSRASCDIASKIVTGRSAKTLFMDVIGRSAARIRRQARGLPGEHPACEMLVVSEPIRLRRQRRGDRPLSGTAGEHDLFACGVRDILRIESGKRHDHGVGIRFHCYLIRLTDVDQEIAPFGDSLRHFCRRQIGHLMPTRHSNTPDDALIEGLCPFAQSRLWCPENQGPQALASI